MNIYNDFPELSDEQYQTMKNEFNIEKKPNLILKLSSNFLLLKRSLDHLKHETNHNCFIVIEKVIEKLDNSISTFSFLFPNTTSKSGMTIINNIFLVNELYIDIIADLQQIINEETKKYYLSLLKKIKANLLGDLKVLNHTYAGLNIKMYKHM